MENLLTLVETLKKIHKDMQDPRNWVDRGICRCIEKNTFIVDINS